TVDAGQAQHASADSEGTADRQYRTAFHVQADDAVLDEPVEVDRVGGRHRGVGEQLGVEAVVAGDHADDGAAFGALRGVAERNGQVQVRRGRIAVGDVGTGRAFPAQRAVGDHEVTQLRFTDRERGTQSDHRPEAQRG